MSKPNFLDDPLCMKMFKYMHILSKDVFGEVWKEGIEFEIWGSHKGDNVLFVYNNTFADLMELYTFTDKWLYRPDPDNSDGNFLETVEWEKLYAED